MAAFRRAFMLVVIGGCSIPSESDYVSDGSVIDATGPDGSSVDAPDDVVIDAARICDAGAYFYNDHCYAYYAAKAPWPAAETQCKQIGGHLAAITDINEQDYVGKTIINTNQSGDASNGVWIGGYLVDAAADAYAWTTGEPFVFSDWGTGAPKGNPSVFMYNAKIFNRWDDFQSNIGASFVCEY